MSESPYASNHRFPTEYRGQKAENFSTQVNGNIGTFNSSSQGNTLEACLAALWRTNPSLTDPLEDRKSLIDNKGPIVRGTCEWIMKNKAYGSWLYSPSQLLWLSGGPGKGKTMLSIFLAEKLEQIGGPTQNDIFIQYFCDNKDEKRNTAIAVLRGLVFQLLKKRENLHVHILPTFKIQGDSLFTESSFGSLWTCFESMVRDPSLGAAYCVIDALDECNETLLKVLLKRLRALFSPNTNQSSSCRLKLIAVSREKPDFAARELSAFPRIRLGPGADSDVASDVNSDISIFITEKVRELCEQKDYSSQLRLHVESVFHERARGTFLWVGIVAKELECCTADEVKDAIDDFHSGLYELYGRMLRQISPKRRETVARILRWVVMAVRPLTLLELGTAIGITAEACPGSSYEKVILEQVEKCGHLLTTTKTSSGKEVGLVHLSARDYLLREDCDSTPELEFFRVKKDDAHLEIATRCLDYFQSGALAGGPVALPGDHSFQKAFPLLSYAVLHWTEHARCLSDPTLDIFDPSLPFYADRSPVRKSWLRTYLVKKKDSDISASSSLLHIASYFGILPLAERLLCNNRWKEDVNKKDRFGMTALHWAVYTRNEAVIQRLIDKGANPNARDKYGQTALHWAAMSKNKAVVQLLIDKGADPNARDKYGQTALNWAAVSKNKAVVQLLIEGGADCNAKGEYGQTALHRAAATLGNEAVVQLLLKEGADSNAKDKYGQTALYRAAATSGNEAVVQLLLKEGADFSAKNKYGETAFHRAVVILENEAVVQLLLKEGADLNAKNQYGQTALHRAAATLGNEATVQLLLEEGADSNAKDGCGKTALHWAAATSGNEAVVQLLLEEGADSSAKDMYENTAVYWAKWRKNEAAIQLLKKADAAAKPKDTLE